MHPTALDLKGSGIDITDTNHVSTLAEYSEPLLDYLQNLSEDEKVWKTAQFSMLDSIWFCFQHCFRHLLLKSEAHMVTLLCRLCWLVTVLGVRAFLMLWSNIPTKLQRQFSFVQRWCLTARGLSMCLRRRWAVSTYNFL